MNREYEDREEALQAEKTTLKDELRTATEEKHRSGEEVTKLKVLLKSNNTAAKKVIQEHAKKTAAMLELKESVATSLEGQISALKEERTRKDSQKAFLEGER